jgi:hypothetical protein
MANRGGNKMAKGKTGMKGKVEFGIADVSMLEKSLKAALWGYEKPPQGCIIEFTKKGIDISSIQPDNVSAMTIHIPKAGLINYQREYDNEKGTSTLNHDYWFTKDELDSLHRILDATKEPSANFVIDDFKMAVKSGKMRKQIRFEQIEPEIRAQPIKGKKQITMLKNSREMTFTAEMDEFAFGVQAIEKLIRSQGQFMYEKSSITSSEQGVNMTVTLENDEMEVGIKKNVLLVDNEPQSSNVNMVELAQGIKWIKKLTPKVNVFARAKEPLILTGEKQIENTLTDVGVSFLYLIAPLVRDDD